MGTKLTVNTTLAIMIINKRKYSKTRKTRRRAFKFHVGAGRTAMIVISAVNKDYGAPDAPYSPYLVLFVVLFFFLWPYFEMFELKDGSCG